MPTQLYRQLQEAPKFPKAPDPRLSTSHMNNKPQTILKECWSLSLKKFLKTRLGFTCLKLSRCCSIARRENEGPQCFPHLLAVHLSHLGRRILSLCTTDIFNGITLCCVAALSIVGCLAASLVSVYLMSEARGQSHPCLRTTDIRKHLKNKSCPHKHLYLNVHSSIFIIA